MISGVSFPPGKPVPIVLSTSNKPRPKVTKDRHDPASFLSYLHAMADVHDKKTRSYNMSRIRSENTKPEMVVRRFLHANGFRYSLNKKTLPGKPDIVLPKYKTIIFIHGCFWHGHTGCKYFVVPKTRTKWWLNKIAANKANDEKAVKALRKGGWKIITVWECRLKPTKNENTLLNLLIKLY